MMKSLQRPMRVSQGFLVQESGAETLVYDETRHEAFCLDALSAAVWRLCDGTLSAAQMSEKATAQLERAVSEDLVLVTLGELGRRGLLQADSMELGRVDALADASRRTMLRRMGVGAALMLPVIAMVAAPKAAQAYNGCVDCTPSNRSQRRPTGGSY